MNILRRCSLFDGVDDDGLSSMLACLKPSISDYNKNDYIALAGNRFECVGIMLSGEAAVIKENAAGNRIIMTLLKPSSMFGEILVFSGNSIWLSNVVALEPCSVMFLSRNKIIGQCGNLCPWHGTMILNMLRIISERALMLNKKVEYLTIKSMRGKISAFLLDQYKKSGKIEFVLPMTRNEMADFLNVSRPSMSREMSRMRDEGIIDFYMSSIKLKDLDTLKMMAE